MRARHEPEERDDPLNDELDEIEARIGAVIASGGEAALRARLARLLPERAKPVERRRGRVGR